MKIYFDANIYDLAMNVMSPNEFKVFLQTKGADIVIGSHIIYEIGRCLLEDNKKKIEKAKSLYAYISDLDISFIILKIDDLIINDLREAKTGIHYQPYYEYRNKKSFIEEIRRLADGDITRAREFISKREKSFNDYNFRQNFLKENPLFSQDKRIKYDELIGKCEVRRQIIDKSQFKKYADSLSNNSLFNEPNKHPYLNSWINANIYFNYLACTTNDGPSRKHTSDLRQLICANAADLFVTDDRGLISRGPKVNPFIKINGWDAFYQK